MVKKILFPLLAAILLAASLSGTAQAAEDGPALVRVRGGVLKVDPAAGEFQIEEPDGTTLTFFVNEETSFRGQAHNLAELQPGWKVGVAARETEDPSGKRLFRDLVTMEQAHLDLLQDEYDFMQGQFQTAMGFAPF